MLPLKSLAVPPEPTVTVAVGVPEINKLPPDDVPAAVLMPALSTKAVAVPSSVETFFDTVRSPVNVPMATVPVAETPLVLPTVPIVSALLST